MKSFKQYILEESNPLVPSHKGNKRINRILTSMKKKAGMGNMSNDAFASEHISSGRIDTDTSGLNRALIAAARRKVKRNSKLLAQGVDSGNRILRRAITPNSARRDRRLDDQVTSRLEKMSSRGVSQEEIRARLMGGSITDDLRGAKQN